MDNWKKSSFWTYSFVYNAKVYLKICKGFTLKEAYVYVDMGTNFHNSASWLAVISVVVSICGKTKFPWSGVNSILTCRYKDKRLDCCWRLYRLNQEADVDSHPTSMTSLTLNSGYLFLVSGMVSLWFSRFQFQLESCWLLQRYVYFCYTCSVIVLSYLLTWFTGSIAG